MDEWMELKDCPCGKVHTVAIDDVVVGSGVIRRLPEFIVRYGSRKPFLLADQNTWKAAGDAVAELLHSNMIRFSGYVFPAQALEPDEAAVGSMFMHFDSDCDLIIGIGSGVINDLGKILSNASGRKYIIVATAPSVDGYASATSSMVMDGLKVSLNSRCADVIIGDTDILKQAPEHMLKAGFGDMLAKYVSIAEWRIGSIITGEYYCEQVAQMIRKALKKCVDHGQGLLRRDEDAVRAVFEALVIGGIAMAYAGVSRPASGVEHYFSHIWDMRALEFGTKADLHGIQCAMATAKTVELYERLKTVVPDAEKARAAVAAFDQEKWCRQLRGFLGRSGEAMILLEQRERKYDKSAHSARFRRIEEHWDEILCVLEEELPTSTEIRSIMDTIGISRDLETIGVDSGCARMTLKASKDIRDKYVLSRLAWDLGVLDELCEIL